MRTTPASAGANLPETIGHLAGIEVAALALVCVMGTGAAAAVAAFITLGGARSARFCHAIEMEAIYCEAVLGFDPGAPPYYGEASFYIDLVDAAGALCIDRILCLVTLDRAGSITVARNYDGIEATLLEAAHTQFVRFREMLAGSSGQGQRSFHRWAT